MAERTNRPGPGQSTAQAAVNEIKKRVAERNRQAQKAARDKDGPHARLKADELRRKKSGH